MSAGPVDLNGPPAGLEAVDRWQRGAWLAGGVGLAACALAAFLGWQEQFFRSYLVAYVLCLGLGLGCLPILMLQHVTGGNWGFILRRPLEAGTRTLPVLAVLFLPVALALFVSDLYPWASPHSPRYQADARLQEHLKHLAPYLNPLFFLIRMAGYFAVWLVLSWLLNSWSRRQDRTNDPSLADKFAGLSAPGLLLYVITVTFAAIDLVMSLEPKWYSTIYGALFGMGQVLSAFAFVVVVFLLLGWHPQLQRVVERHNLRDLGSLMLAFVMVWAYLGFSQFLLIWAGNLPEEVPWYKSRLEGGWSFVGLSLIVCHFALPFVLLLMSDVKRNRRSLAGVAFLLLGMRIIDLVWLIFPAFTLTENEASIDVGQIVTLLAALVGVGGIWLGAYLWQVERWPLLPVHPPVVEGGNHHG